MALHASAREIDGRQSHSFAADAYRFDRRLEAAAGMLESDQIEVVSTDVFDTLIWRKVREPIDAFAIVGERLARGGLIEKRVATRTFAQLRIGAERRARVERKLAAGQTEVTLTEIYGCLPDWLFVDTGRKLDALAVEVGVEEDLLLPDREFVSLLTEAANRGKTLIGVSDTYFEREHMDGFLRRTGLEDLPFRQLFLSNEHRTDKNSELFSIVLKELAVEPGRVVHIGDHDISDVEAPKRLGIKHVHYRRRAPQLSEILEREQKYLLPPAAQAEVAPRATGDFGLATMRTKVAESTHAESVPSDLRPFWVHGATVLGPLLTGFAAWCDREAAELGVSRLYCPMREGGVLAELINRHATATGSSVTAEPVWINRLVSRQAAILEASAEELELIACGRNAPTVRGLCEMLDLWPALSGEFAQHANTRLEDVEVAGQLIGRITGDESLKATAVESTAEVRDRLVRYVEQRIDVDQDRFVLVDLGWGASTQRHLAKVLAAAGLPIKVAGFYMLTTDSSVEASLDNTEVRGFLGDSGMPELPVSAIMRSPELLEQACMTDSPSQIGIDRQLEPVLGRAELVPAAQLLEIQAAQDGIGAFQSQWLRYRTSGQGESMPSLADADVQLRAIAHRAIASPLAEEARLVGGWHHDENLGSSHSEPIVKQTDIERAPYLDPSGWRDLSWTSAYWPMGALALGDARAAALAQAVETGEIDGELLGSELDVGAFKVYPTRGEGIENALAFRVQLRRNQLGLTHVNGGVEAPTIDTVRVTLSEKPCVVRIDWLEFGLWEHGKDAPTVVRMERGEGLQRLGPIACGFVEANVVVCGPRGGSLDFSLRDEVGGPVYRVDVDCGLAVLPTAPGSFEDIGNPRAVRAELDAVKASVSWRLTAPLRWLKTLIAGTGKRSR